MLFSCNPFAPSYDPDGLSQVDLLGDQSNIDGFFLRFKNAYELRDTALYARLFSRDFIFEYYDQELGQDVSWDRATELLTSFNLFQSSLQINLDWNFYVDLGFYGHRSIDYPKLQPYHRNRRAGDLFRIGEGRFRLSKGNPAAPWGSRLLVR